MDHARIALALLDGVIAGAISYERAKLASDQIKTMIAEGRDPTAEEWDALRAEGIALDTRLDAAAARLND